MDPTFFQPRYVDHSLRRSSAEINVVVYDTLDGVIVSIGAEHGGLDSAGALKGFLRERERNAQAGKQQTEAGNRSHTPPAEC